MNLRTRLPWPDKCLRTKAEDVPEITDENPTIRDDMIDTMEAMSGVGLAAPQIGVMLQLAIVNGSTVRGKVVRPANPEILHSSIEPRKHEEASPNLPGVSAKMNRPCAVTVKLLSDQEMVDRRDFVVIATTSLQHRIDHLNGRMYFDRLSKVKRDMLLRKARKLKYAELQPGSAVT